MRVVAIGAGDLKPKSPLHLFTHLLEPLQSATANLGSRPSGKADVTKGLAHIRPRQVTFTDLGKLAFRPAESLDVQLHATVTEGANPLTGLAVFPVVTDIVILAYPGAVETVNKLHMALRALLRWCPVIIEHLVPDILKEDRLAKGGSERN